MKVAVLTPIPTPYRDPFWNKVAAHPAVDLDVFYCSAGKADRPWAVNWPRSFRWEVLPGYNLLSWRGAAASCFWNPAIVRRLSQGGYDALVVGGYNHLTMLAAIAFSMRRRIPYFMMCETYRQTSSPWKALLKRNIVRPIMRRAAGTFPTGTLSTEYVIRYGAAPECVVPIPNVPDVESLGVVASRLQQERQQKSETSRPIVLFVARLIPKKRAGLLIRAFARSAAASNARLVIVGDGPDRAALQQLATDVGIADRTEFPGFVQPEKVVHWYSAASVFVLPSSETWGVSAIEALSCRVPIIVTDEVGCHPDVVTDHRVGRVVKARDEGDLVAALDDLLQARPAPAAIEQAWRPTHESFRYDRLVERMVGGLRNGLTASPASSQQRQIVSS